MKKILSFITLILILVCLFASCGGGQIDGPGSGQGGNNNPPEPEHTHAFGEWATVVEATCVTEGLIERHCSCGEKEIQSIPMVDHIFSDNGYDCVCTECGMLDENGFLIDIFTALNKQDGDIVRVRGTVYDINGKSIYIADYDGSTICVYNLVAEVSIGDTLTVRGTLNTYKGEREIRELTSFSVDKHECVFDIPCFENAICNICGKENNAPTDHDYCIVEEKKATCLPGNIWYTCSFCGDNKWEEIAPAFPHTEIVIPGYEPSCTTTGLSDGKACSVCDTIFVLQEEIPATGHTVVIDNAVAPTCTSPGLTQGKHCSVCDKVIVRQNTVKATGHTEVIDAAVSATCTQTGLSQGKHCSVCSEVLIAQVETPLTAHIYSSDTDITCNICGYTRECSHTDTYTVSGKAPTCTEPGLTEGIRCRTCREYLVVREVIPALGHTEIIDEAVDPTCTETGLTEGKHCSVCNATIIAQITVLANGHTEVIDEAVAATCISTGLTEGKHCSTCDKVFVAQKTLPVIDCIESEWIIDSEPTVTEDGSCHTVCTMCGRTMVESKILYATGSLGLKYSLNSDKQSYSVVGIGSCKDLDIVIPKFYNELPVTSVGNSAFYGCDSLTNIKIPDSVKNIGNWAFRTCTKLTSISFGDDSQLTSIGSDAFEDCASLMNIVIPNNVTSIGYSAFRGCKSLKSIAIPNSVTSLDDYVFGYCTMLTSITFGNDSQLTRIGQRAFENCTSLTSIVIPDSVTSIGSCAFSDCTSLESITIPFIGATKDGIENTHFGYIFGDWYSSNNADYADNQSVPASLKYVVISYGLSIDNYAFWECTSIESIVIPCGVKSIGEHAFYDCTSLTSIVIPDSVTSIGYCAFYDCTSLAKVTIGNGVTSIGNSAFNSCDSLTDIVIPDSVISIGNSAFNSCDSLTDIVIPDSVISIGNSAFYGCKSLTSVTIGKSVRNIGSHAFSYCTSLIVVKFVDNNQLTSFSDYLFYDCTSLKSVTVPINIESISFTAFNYCHKIVEVINKSSLPITAGYESYSKLAFYAIEVHTGESKIVNQNDFLFYAYNGINYLVGYVGNDTELILPDNYNGANYEIYQHAFRDCHRITSMVISSGVTSIGFSAFRNCEELESVIISNDNGTTSIGQRAFCENANLTNVAIGNGVTSIGDSAFEDCKSLKSIRIGSDITSIGSYAFDNCTGLMEVYISDVAAWCNISFRSNPLSKAHNLYLNGELVSELVIPYGVTSIGYLTFKDCTSIMSIVIPDSVTSIGNHAFQGCTGITSIVIPDGLTSIGYRAFDGCTHLTDIYYKGTEDMWAAITINSHDDSYLANATIHYNYVPEE